MSPFQQIPGLNTWALYLSVVEVMVLQAPISCRHLPLTLPPNRRIRTPEFPGGPCFRSFAFCEGSPSASALRPQVSFRFGVWAAFGAEPKRQAPTGAKPKQVR